MKKITVLFLIAVLMLTCVGAFAQQPVRVASLKGPTSMGLVKMMQDDKDQGDYQFTVAGTADEIVPLLVKGELDIALVPCNLASVLYNKTQGGVQVAAINVLGVLYVVQVGDEVSSIQDLKGKTILSTGKGTTPEYSLNAILMKNGIDPAKDLTIEFKSEATEVASLLGAGQASLAVLPQPFVTAASTQNPNLKVALSLTDCWNEVMPESAMVTGTVIVRKDFAQNNPEKVAAFFESYRASTAFTNEHPDQAASWIEELGIAKAAVAQKAIPHCNIVCIEGDEMKAKVSGYLSALHSQDAASVGGQLPGDDFYYAAN